MTDEQGNAAKAAQLATTAALDLLTIVRFGDGRKGALDASEAESRLLRATKLTMELAGFHPDEKERGELYRAISSYVSRLRDD
jgi:hypothetical protein